MPGRRIEAPERRRHEASRRRARRSLVAAVAALAISSWPVWAMDCGKAAGAVETTICADPALKAQDARLGHLYFASLKALSGRRHDTLIEDQRIWLAERSEECANVSADRSACIERLTAARIAEISACYASAAPKGAADVSCPVAAHAACPQSRVSASVRVWSYPFLIARLVARADSERKDNADRCALPDNPFQNTSDYKMTVDGAGPGWVTVRSAYYAEFRGLPHAVEVHQAETYEVPAGKVFALTRLLPRLATDKTVAGTFWNAAKAPGSQRCCGEETPSLAESGDDVRYEGKADDAADPLPVAWSIRPNGDLTVFYAYYSLGRSYIAGAVVKRSVFIGWVDPRYARLFAEPR